MNLPALPLTVADIIDEYAAKVASIETEIADFTAAHDRIGMPPFYGRNYLKHVRHAERFLKAGGTLVAILPATARYDHDELTGEWRDLPVASFADAGTNVPTTMLRIRKR